jgi:hypothetical protein
VRKRRARLLAAADDAFAHVRRVRLSASHGHSCILFFLLQLKPDHKNKKPRYVAENSCN